MVIGSNILAGSSGQVSGAYEIDQSIRFNDNDSARLERTVSSSGSLTTWTLSVWVKRGKYTENVNGQWFPVFSASNGLTANDAPLYFNDVSTGGAFNVKIAGLNWRTSALARDVSAWYHCVIVWDSNNGTTADRMRLYINGERVTDFSSSASPSSGANSRWNSSSYSHHRIGNMRYSSAETTYVFDGYLAEINFIDGTALDPTSFGETNSTTGQWVPKEYTGSYGTNGFYLKGEDSSDLGNDSSGNGNDFTSSALAAADQVTDSPTDNFATWNPVSGTSTNAATFSDGNLTAIRSSGGTNIVGSTASFPATGNWYAEFTIDATGSGSFIWQVGIIEVDDAERFDTSEPRLGQAAKGYAYTTNWSGSPVPSKQNNNSAVSYGTGGSATDVIGVHLNNGTLVFYHNNVSQGTAYSGITGEYIFAWSGQSGAKVTANFGQSGFTYTPPTGAVALSTANLDDPAIADPSAYFQTTLYTGNGSTQEVNQSGNSNFESGLVWIKTRSNAASHALFDQVRGVNKQLRSDSNGAEYTAYSDLLTAFDADGFTLGADATVNNVNVNTYTYAAWQWAADGTSGSSNTDGDITSTVSANTTSGVSVLTYSGNGSDNQEIGHGLGIAPKMIITKRTDTSGNWTTYHDAVGINKVFYLNSTAAPTSNTEQYRAVPTSSVYTVGVGGDINNSSGNYVAYVFGEVDGFSRISSFVGNGSSEGPFIYMGFRPAIFMMKRYDSTGAWLMFDDKRDGFNVDNDNLRADQTVAEQTDDFIDIVSNGVKIRSSATTWLNASGGDYLYMAFAASPFKTATAR